MSRLTYACIRINFVQYFRSQIHLDLRTFVQLWWLWPTRFLPKKCQWMVLVCQSSPIESHQRNCFPWLVLYWRVSDFSKGSYSIVQIQQKIYISGRTNQDKGCRKQCFGSVSFWYGSGSGSDDYGSGSGSEVTLTKWILFSLLNVLRGYNLYKLYLLYIPKCTKKIDF